MSAAEQELLSSVIRTKDILPLLHRDVRHVFNSYGDVAEFLDDYYRRYKAVPELEFVQERFPDFDDVKTSGPVEHYLEKAEEAYLASELEKILVGAAENLPKVGARRIIEGLEKKLSKVKHDSGDIDELDITDYQLAQEHYEEVRTKVAESGGAVGIRTGLDSIDFYYPTGIAPGHKVTLIGWPSKGKSWFGGFLAIQAWLQGYKPLILSLEMSTTNMRDRIYTMMGEGMFAMSGLAVGDVNPDNFREWGKKYLDSKQPFKIISGDTKSQFTPNKLQAKIDQLRPDFVVVDYLQLMSDNGGTKDTTARYTNLSHELKNIAIANDIALVDITAATAKEVEDREKPPTMAQVAWAKAIEYDADLAMAVHRHDDSKLVEIVSRKNRHGGDFALYLEWDINRGVMREVVNG